MTLTLNDLSPKKSVLELGGKKYVLKPFSLRAQNWAFEKYGPKAMKDLLSKQHLPTVADIAYFLMEDKTDFPTVDDFMEAVITQHDRVNLTMALLDVVGVSQPMVDKIVEEEKQAGERRRLRRSTGAKSTTALPEPTDTESKTS